MAVFESIVILFMISSCWSSELPPATKTAATLDDSQLSMSKEQSCPTWYRETEYNGVTRCVCGATLEDGIVCNYTTQETLIFAGYCMSYNDTTNDTVAGECLFSEENLEREAPVIEMMHAVGKEAAPDSHPSIVQMSYKCDIVITGQ